MSDHIEIVEVIPAKLASSAELNVDTSKASQRYDNDRIETLEDLMLSSAQVDCPLFHHFAPGVYIREVVMPKGTFVVGHCHKTEHFNVVLAGKASVMMGDEVHHVTAPAIIKSGPGVRKVFYVHEELRWATVHSTPETDVQKLEEDLVIPSPTFTEHELLKLREAASLIQ